MNAETEELIPAWVDGTLAPVGKLEVHQRGLRHKAVSVFVTDGGRVLIQRRALSKYHTPGLWANTCCTHPRWDEDAATCALRRLREELGITGLVPALADRVEYRADVGGGLIEHELVDIFVAEAGAGLVVAPDPDEVMDTRWVELHDLSDEVRHSPERFTPWLKIYMTEHMARIFGASVGVGR
ncbi:isopentenyl-diphosphate Delta-isomerase [Pseudotabrizicola alkalilacus]|uniref:Isopentenyl-diphosphate Delta-isomerase n=1 Tax=Pseudotabrizicola alkalilacus TaxID=2305252 RepID=A0A411Z1Z4_9RHOB|nr:isopentenyl-diphosphate Delta-isomerase [Pseudotabrizicola alkalilacus]RGP37060.1 isopentenyl-diphosphate Delta-isomerase [Pseudotabrizicola alkalilacus]